MKPPNKTPTIRKEGLKNIDKQKKEYTEITENIIKKSEVILEVIDARFIQETRNTEFEKEIRDRGKEIVYVINKSDLVSKINLEIIRKENLYPHVIISSKERKGVRRLRSLIKKVSKKFLYSERKEKVTVGVVGYPNTGKSSVINVLVGRKSAPSSSQAGFTQSMQKIKLNKDIALIDSPGIIPSKEYSSSDMEKIAKHAKVGGRTYNQIKEPDLVVSNLMKEHPGVLEKHYGIDAKEDAEELIERLGEESGFYKKGGEIDEERTAKQILKDWQEGKISLE